MNLIDFIIIGVVGLFVLGGWVKGFIKEIGSLVGFFISLWLAGLFFMQMSVPLKPLFASWPAGGQFASYVAAYVLIFVISQIVLGFLIVFLDGIFKLVSFVPFLKTINHSGGAVIGLIEGALMVSFVIFIMGKYPFSPDLSKALKASIIAPPLAQVTNWFLPLLPNSTKLLPSIFDLKTAPGATLTPEQWANTVPETK